MFFIRTAPPTAPAQSLLQLTAPGGRVRVELLPLDLADASEEELEAACRGMWHS